jgi:hypothetical protein
MHESFVNVARYRYAIFAGLVGAACLISYLIDSAFEAPNGGTVLGYTLGTIAAAQVIYLMGYGIKRRSFGGRAGSTTRWLSIHVYVGLSALLIASLHCGFQFGNNVHTFAYGLMCLVVLSGCWGVYAYLRYPALIVRERGGVSREVLLTRLAELDRQALAVAAAEHPDVQDLVADAIHRTRLGGGVWEQLRGRDASVLLLSPVREAGFAKLVSNRDQHALIGQLARHQAIGKDGDSHHRLNQLLQISGEKAVVLRRLQRDVQLQGLLQYWLYLHLPLSFGMLAALVVHIFSVFFYR